MSRPNKFDLLALLACLGLALAFRLPGLTVFLTADEARSWFGRSIIFLDSLARGDWANSAPGGTVSFIDNVSLSPAPGVTTMWTGALGLLFEYVREGMPGSLAHFLRTIPFDPLDPAMLFSLRLPGVLIAVAAAGLTYWWSRPLLGRWGAFLAAGLLALDPFHLALSRVLGHDALVSTFMWLSVLALLRAAHERREMEEGRWEEGDGKRKDSDTFYVLRFTFYVSHFTPVTLFLILSGLCAGLAILSKYPALFLGAFTALALFILNFLPPSAHDPGTAPLAPRSGALVCRRRGNLYPALAGHVGGAIPDSHHNYLGCSAGFRRCPSERQLLLGPACT